MRKAIQLVVMPAGDGVLPQVFALCDDGSIWSMARGAKADKETARKWRRVESIPADPKNPGIEE